jgi:type II secretion system protein H
MRAQSRSAGFTLIEILVVVLIIGIVSAGVLLSVNLTGRDHELEKESDRLLTLVNYAREQAELQTREYGIIFHDDGYQFLAYDARRGIWREVYEDDILRQRKLPDGLDFKLVVETRPVVLTPTGEQKKSKTDSKAPPKTLKDLESLPQTSDLKDALAHLKDATTAGHSLEDKMSSDLDDSKAVVPQVMIFSSGDLTSFEVTLERDAGVRSVTLSQDDKGQVVAKPMVENKA